jgi:two-component system, response regulator PdtaR
VNRVFRILIVEDEALIALALQVELTRAGYLVCGVAGHGVEAITLAISQTPDVILMDINLSGGMDGIATAWTIRARQPVPVVFLSGYFADEAVSARVQEFGPLAFLSKPVMLGELQKILLLLEENRSGRS